MLSQISNVADLALTPLGAGDLIDRSIRFYRRNFAIFFMIAAPPVVFGTLISLAWTILGRQLFTLTADPNNPEQFVYYLFSWLGSFVIWIGEMIATLVVMGGASRNFVRHLLFGEWITFRETYLNVKKRIFSLFVASTLIVFFLGFLGFIIFYFGFILTALLIALIAMIFASIPFVAVVLSVVFGVAGIGLTLWLFFIIASRFAFVPQVILVEGLSVGSAIGRSATLASGSSRRLMALFIFTLVATYSALAIFYVPLAWYGWGAGVDLTPFADTIVPAWFEISYGLISQVSFILLSPVLMIGLCLMYVDERVRSEGYDIELMAARRLGDIPQVPLTYINPLQPAMSTAHRNPTNPIETSLSTKDSGDPTSILGLR